MAPLQPDFDGGQLTPSAAGLEAQPYSPSRTAFVVLADEPANRLYASLVKRYQAALSPLASRMDLI
eukprot:2570468-Prymnesium_polylepis.1